MVHGCVVFCEIVGQRLVLVWRSRSTHTKCLAWIKRLPITASVFFLNAVTTPNFLTFDFENLTFDFENLTYDFQNLTYDF